MLESNEEKEKEYVHGSAYISTSSLYQTARFFLKGEIVKGMRFKGESVIVKGTCFEGVIVRAIFVRSRVLMRIKLAVREARGERLELRGPTSEQRGNNVQGAKDFYLKIKAFIWP